MMKSSPRTLPTMMPSRWARLKVCFDVGVGAIDVELDEGEIDEVNEGDNDIVEDDEVGVAVDVEVVGRGVEEGIAVEGIAGEVVRGVGSVTV